MRISVIQPYYLLCSPVFASSHFSSLSHRLLFPLILHIYSLFLCPLLVLTSAKQCRVFAVSGSSVFHLIRLRNEAWIFEISVCFCCANRSRKNIGIWDFASAQWSVSFLSFRKYLLMPLLVRNLGFYYLLLIIIEGRLIYGSIMIPLNPSRNTRYYGSFFYWDLNEIFCVVCEFEN